MQLKSDIIKWLHCRFYTDFLLDIFCNKSQIRTNRKNIRFKPQSIRSFLFGSWKFHIVLAARSRRKRNFRSVWFWKARFYCVKNSESVVLNFVEFPNMNVMVDHFFRHNHIKKIWPYIFRVLELLPNVIPWSRCRLQNRKSFKCFDRISFRRKFRKEKYKNKK